MPSAAPHARQPMRDGGPWVRWKAQWGALALIFRLGWRHLRSFRRTWAALREMERQRRAMQGDAPLRKAAYVDGRVYWDPTAPGYPSPALVDYYRRELNAFQPFLEHPGLRVVYFSITKKCSLRCRHCYEWNHLGRPERLSAEALDRIVAKLQEHGTGVIFFEGGEPLQRFDDLLYVLDRARDSSAFWIITSGLGMTAAKARALKRAGLTGLMVSLDHWRARRHNDFRGHPRIYQQALEAVGHGNRAGLVTAFSLCVTREMSIRSNIDRYMRLALDRGVSFVQWLEPRRAGRWQDADVELTPEHIAGLEQAFRDYNLSATKADYPLILYPGHFQRREGCPGAGIRFLYIDSNGEANACPFCQQPVGNLLENPLPVLLDRLKRQGCAAFAPFRSPALTPGPRSLNDG